MVESNPLTNDQRLGVIRSNDLNMVLAAAGTGKTSVIVAKALDLIDRGLAKADEILVLAYNNTAAKDVSHRYQDKAKKSGVNTEILPRISTFHALGRQILKEKGQSTRNSVFSDDETKLNQWVSQWLIDYLSANDARLFAFIRLFPEPVNPFEFTSMQEYEAYHRDNEFRTLNGDRVKGYQELLISNFLFIKGISFKYEAPYVSKRRINIGFDYKPDFHLTGTNIYIEHFGIDRAGNTRADIDAEKYKAEMKSKIELHQSCGTELIQTFHYEWVEDTLETHLMQQLNNFDIAVNPIAPETILEKLKEEGQVHSWSHLFTKVLQAIRVERLTKNAIIERLTASDIAQANKFADIFDHLHQSYIQELSSQQAIDFDDMIIKSTALVKQGRYQPKWKYLLVDEFQDISMARMDMVQSLIKHGNNPSLTVVGDDWQSIYRFSGGKLELTTRFNELIGNHTLTKLQKTFRYNNSIADTAGQFVMQNPEQFQKFIETNEKVSSPRVRILDDKIGVEDGLYKRIIEIITTIRANDKTGSILVLGRYNKQLKKAGQFIKQHRLHENVSVLSFHKSKGLEGDHTILIGFSQGKMGFPSENTELAVIDALMPALDKYPFSEERRLMYVALTRAKQRCYIIADPTSPSVFITELLSSQYQVDVVSPSFAELQLKIYKCPHCFSGQLKLMKGQYGEFYTCSAGNACSVGKARVCQKCSAPSIDTRENSRCNNPACSHSFKICPKCGRPMNRKNGQKNDFWGCSGYGVPSDKCNYTESIK